MTAQAVNKSESNNAAPAAFTSPQPTPPARLPRLTYSLRETADMLGVSCVSVHRLLKRGLLKSSNALRHKLIPSWEIERFVRNVEAGTSAKNTTIQKAQ